MERMKLFSVVLFGECMIELQEMTPGIPQQGFGGDTLNCAVYMSRLHSLFPARIEYATALGRDRFSGAMMQFWEQEGVGSSLVLQEEGELPGLYYIDLDEDGERHFTYWRGQAAVKKCFEYEGGRQLLDELASYDLFYLSGISLAVLTPVGRQALLGRLAQLHGSRTKIAFDYNFRPTLWGSLPEAQHVYEEVLEYADIAFAGSDELMQLHSVGNPQEMPAFFGRHKVQEWVIRNGAAPCKLWSDGETTEIPLPAVENVVDTTAAGDSFSAAWLMARLAGGCNIETTTRFAHEMASYVIGHKGAIAPKEKEPDFTAILDTLRGNHE